jgi:hypothetical protein
VDAIVVDDRRQEAKHRVDGINTHAVRQTIDRPLGLEMADGNGKFDYAPIRSGA